MSDDKGTSLRWQCLCPGCESHRRESEKLIEELRHKIYILESVIDMYVIDREEIKSHVSEEMIARHLPSVANIVRGEVERLSGECERRQHIINVLRQSIGTTALTAKTIEESVLFHEGKLQVWCLGNWSDVEDADKEPGDE